MSNHKEHRLQEKDSDADDVSEQNDEYSDEVIPSKRDTNIHCILLKVVLFQHTFIWLNFNLPDSVGQKAEVHCPRGGQGSEEQRSSRKDPVHP